MSPLHLEAGRSTEDPSPCTEPLQQSGAFTVCERTNESLECLSHYRLCLSLLSSVNLLEQRYPHALFTHVSTFIGVCAALHLSPIAYPRIRADATYTGCVRLCTARVGNFYRTRPPRAQSPSRLHDTLVVFIVVTSCYGGGGGRSLRSRLLSTS